MSVCLCLVVSESIIQRPVSCFPRCAGDMCGQCWQCNRPGDWEDTEDWAEERSNKWSATVSLLGTPGQHWLLPEHWTQHWTLCVWNNKQSEFWEYKERCMRAAWPRAPAPGMMTRIPSRCGAGKFWIYVYVWGFHACQNRFISSINIPIFDKRCINFRYWTFCVRAALRSIHLRYDTTSLADKCFHYNLSTTYLFWTVSASVHKTDTWWRRKSQ